MKQTIIISSAIFMILSVSSCSLFTKTKTMTLPSDFPTTETSSKDKITSSLKYESDSQNTSHEKDGTDSDYAIKDKEIEGEWTITNVYNTKVNMYTMPFLNFEIQEGRLYGNNGCNTINGDFTTTKNGKIHFNNILTTMMECHDNKIGDQIIKAINNTTAYSFSLKDGLRQLKLHDKRGNTIMIMRSHNLNILNGMWTVTEIGQENINDANIQLVIDIQEGRIHGNSGCNIINGNVVLDPKKKHAIQFSQLISTRKACPNMSTETALLVALEEVEFYKEINSDKIELYDNKNKCTLIIERINLE